MVIAQSISLWTAVTLWVFWLTFVFFNAVMHLRTVRDAGLLNAAPFVVKCFAYLTLFVGLILDVTLNFLLSFLLLEIPQEWLTTDRVKRLKIEGNRWQRACSIWLCKQLGILDFNHCGD